MLRNPPPDAELRQLDARAGLIARHWEAIDAGLEALPPEGRESLYGSAPRPGLETGDDRLFDAVALTLLDGLEPWRASARPLAAALARLIEDTPRLTAGSARALGSGFEDLLAERMVRRFARLPLRAPLLRLLHVHHVRLLEEPDEGERALERDLGEPLSEDDRAWLAIERRVMLLRRVRQSKTNAAGHIRWYVDLDSQGRPVLERLGTEGHWLLLGTGGESALTRLGTAAEHVLFPPGSSPVPGWNVISTLPLDEAGGLSLSAASVLELAAGSEAIDDSFELRRRVRAEVEARPPASRTVRLDRSLFESVSAPAKPSFFRSELAVRDERLTLLVSRPGEEPWPLASIKLEADDDAIASFLGSLDRIADLGPPFAEVAPEHAGATAVAWSHALLKARSEEVPEPGRLSGLKVRIVYVPSSLPHPLGGVPEVGAAFLCDRLENEGARVSYLKIMPSDLVGRLPELLGADAVCVGVYIHNRDEVAQLVRDLREAGFSGKIVLGGPEARHVERVQERIAGWDAIIRGEAEETLPEILDILRLLDAGDISAALARAAGLRGVILRIGRVVAVCDSAANNRASVISCPLPYAWSRGGRRHLFMNFTRGCPYLCDFCPNHQGRKFRAGPVEELWGYTVRAVADHLPLPPGAAEKLARTLQARLGIDAPPRLALALDLLWRRGPSRHDAQALLSDLEELIDRPLLEAAGGISGVLELDADPRRLLTAVSGDRIGARKGKEIWLLAKAELLACREIRRRRGEEPAWAGPRFVLQTSEDNTLVNRDVIAEYLRRRRACGLHRDFIFHPGQNTIRDLLADQAEPNEELISLLSWDNPFAISFGTDGTSNAVIRQHRKPGYGVAGLMAVNRALGRRRVRLGNNFILLAPETNLLEAVEAFLLFLLIPVRWRYYSKGINLRVIKEETTLAMDEGLIFAPGDTEFDVPLRYREVAALLDRWKLTSRVYTDQLRPLLRRILSEDPDATAVLPRVVRRWERDLDQDPELVALAQLIRREEGEARSLNEALWRVEAYIHREGLADGRHMVATFRELAAREAQSHCRDAPI